MESSVVPPGRTASTWVAVLGLAALVALALAGVRAPGATAQEVAPAHHPKPATLTATVRDLGTLGGSFSEASAVDGTVVVGWSETARGRSHAFVYDLAAASPRMVDLGPGGWRMFIDDGMVVSADPAYAYDLRAPAPPHRIPLTAPHGEALDIAALSNRIVAGSYFPNDRGIEHAFAIDLTAATPTLRDLGTLGGHNSRASGMAGSFVLGFSDTAGRFSHAFAFDVSSPAGAMLDISPAQLHDAFPAASSGAVVVGDGGRTFDSMHWLHFRTDLSVSPPATVLWPMRTRDNETIATDGQFVLSHDPQTQSSYVTNVWGDQSQLTGVGRPQDRVFAADVDQGVVVGNYEGATQRGMAWDALAPVAAAIELPTPLGAGHRLPPYGDGDATYSLVWAVDGTTVVGGAAVHGEIHAVAWTLTRAPTSTITVDHGPVVAHEGHRAVLTVRRSAPAEGSASVRWVTRTAASPQAGVATAQDVGMRRGLVTFAPGQKTATARIPVVADAAAEGPERFSVELFAPGGGMLGLEPWTAVVIEP
jgi:probable HAF family extracellular repeat protein